MKCIQMTKVRCQLIATYIRVAISALQEKEK